MANVNLWYLNDVFLQFWLVCLKQMSNIIKLINISDVQHFL